MVKLFRVTGVWSDGLDVTEEHKSWEAAQDFIGELAGVDSIVTIRIEKVFADNDEQLVDMYGPEGRPQ